MKKNYFLFSTMTLVMLFFMAFTNNAKGQLYVNEFLASNDASFPGPQGDFPDWIEIYNAGSADVMLGGYCLFDTYDHTGAIEIPSTYPDSVTVPAGGFLVFYANKGEASSVMNLNFKLSGGGEQIGLWGPDQMLIDSLTYGPQETDISYGRYPDGSDTWFTMTENTPGAANVYNPVPTEVELYINEFLASNDSSFPGPQGDFPDWIEIYNAGSADVMLGGYYLFDTYDLTGAIEIPSTYPDSVTVPAGGFLVFYANKGEASSVMNLNFKLSGGGEQIGLWGPDEMLIDSLTYGPQETDISYGRYPDGSDTWFTMTENTPGAANIYNPGPVEVELYINEFMASNDFALPGPQGDYPDWIEIYNAGKEAVDLSGYYMYDALDVAEAYQISATYPDSVTVPAGGFIVFYANGNPGSSVMNLDFKLSGGGEQIGLWNMGQAVVDTLTYAAQMADTSYGRYADGSENWYLMTDFTPGAANIYNPGPVEVELYINEFMASNDFALPGPQGDYPDWIEIYNAGPEGVMLGGYYMYDALDVTAAYQISDTYPDSVTVAAGGFIVFYANGNPGSSVMNLDFKLSGGGEQIGFWAPDMALIDTLSYTEQIADTSYGRYPDGSAEWFMMPNYTPGAANQPVGINEMNNNISQLSNSPNPFSNETNIEFTLENSDNVVIQLFDARGALVKVLADGNFQTGTHSVNWTAAGLKAGYYFYTLQTSTNFLSRKALIVK